MNLAPVTAGILERLHATDVVIGDGRKPDGAGWQGAAGTSRFVTYVVLYPLGPNRTGPDSPISDVKLAPVLRYQTTAVGRDRHSAEVASDIAAAEILKGAFDVPGVQTVMVRSEGSLGTSVDESESPALFITVERYRVDVIPA